jgi:nucleoside 2-deoxyribosyltransferase
MAGEYCYSHHRGVYLSMKLFVITPHYSDPSFTNKRELLIEIADKYGIEVIFGSNRGSETDVDESLVLLENAELVIADLSLERPSCYYEIGFAQSKNKSVYLIASVGTEIHQVRSKNKVQFYESLSSYRELITEFFSRIASNSNRLQ